MALIDVIIPCYNYGMYLNDSIESVLRQTFQDFNLFIIDDGSTDNTREVGERFQSIHPNIHYVFHENRGLPAARNVGLKLSTAPFIAFLDADDVWMPKKLEESLRLFSLQPNIGMVYTVIELMDNAGNQLSPARPCAPVKGNVFRQLLFRNRIVSPSSVLLRRECIDKVGGFDELLPCCADWDLWLRITRFFQIDFVANPMVKVRIHPSNMHKNVEKMVRDKLVLIHKALRDESKVLSDIEQSVRANLYLTVSRQYIDIGSQKKTLQFILKALITKPLYSACHPFFRETISLLFENTLFIVTRRVKRFIKVCLLMAKR